MQIELKIIGTTDPNVKTPDSERKSISVETHARRGETFTIQKVDTIMEGEEKATTFNIPTGGRLVVTTPLTTEEIVYDPVQGAAIRKSAQVNQGAVADQSTGTMPPLPNAQNTSQPRPLAPDTPPPPTGTDRASGITRGSVTPGQPVKGPEPSPDAAKKAEEQRAAQTSQTSGAGRPAGETPPRPGSPVGSPPSGNEGEDNKK